MLINREAVHVSRRGKFLSGVTSEATTQSALRRVLAPPLALPSSSRIRLFPLPFSSFRLPSLLPLLLPPRIIFMIFE